MAETTPPPTKSGPRISSNPIKGDSPLQHQTHLFDAETIDAIFYWLGLMNVDKCYETCEYFRQAKCSQRVPADVEKKTIDFRSCVDSIANIFKTFGPSMTQLKANFRHMTDSQSILAISRLFGGNFPKLEHFDFAGSFCYPANVSNNTDYLPNLAKLRSLKMSDFPRCTDDQVVANYLEQCTETLDSLTLERMTINGSCLNTCKPLKSLTLRLLATLNVDNVHKYLNRCESMVSLDLELPGFLARKNTKLLGVNMVALKMLKLQVDNRRRMQIDVSPIIKMVNLTTLELEICSMLGLNEVIKHLATINQIERMSLCLNDFLEQDTIGAFSHFTKLRTLKLIVNKNTHMPQLYTVLTCLPNDTQMSTFELDVCVFDASALSRLQQVKHLVIRVNGALENLHTIALLTHIRTIELTMHLHDQFFLRAQDEDAIEMVRKISATIGIAKLTMTLMTGTLNLPTMTALRELAASNNMTFHITEDIYWRAGVTSYLRYEVVVNEKMCTVLKSFFAEVSLCIVMIPYVRLSIDTGEAFSCC